MKKILLITLFSSSVTFAENMMQNKYISANVNLLSGSFASINYGNNNNNLEYNMSGKTRINGTFYDYMGREYTATSIIYKVSLLKKFNKSFLGSIIKDNFISIGGSFSYQDREYKNTFLYEYASSYSYGSDINKQGGLHFTYGSKFSYSINDMLGLEIHIPYVSTNIQFYSLNNSRTNYNLSAYFLNDAVINVVFNY